MDSNAVIDLRNASQVIQGLLFAGQFAQAEPLVRTCLQQVPQDLYFLSQLDIVLNGQGQAQQADEVEARIQAIWESQHKAAWEAKGRPVGEATWARMIAPARQYHVVGTQYYQPEVIGSPPATITSFYKLLALPRLKDRPPRLFKLEMSRLREEFYVLRESLPNGAGCQVIPYGPRQPEVRTLVAHTVAFLDAESQPPER
ncbi:MAG: hypothetical protein AB1894_28055 [Chloroflexota bacterium]